MTLPVHLRFDNKNWQNLVQYDNIFNEKVAAAVGHRSFSSIFHFRQISKFKKRHCSQKKNWIKMSCGYAHLHIYVLHNYKVSRNSVERFQRSCASKKNRTDWLTDGSKTLYPPQLVAWGMKIVTKQLKLCKYIYFQRPRKTFLYKYIFSQKRRKKPTHPSPIRSSVHPSL